MLDAKYLWDIPDSVVAIWEELEDWAISDIIERILKMDELNQTGIGGTARYRIELLQRMGMDMNDVLREISQYAKKSEKELKELFLDAGTRSLDNDAAVLIKYGIKTAMLSNNEWAKQILQMMYDKTNGELRNFTGTFAQSYQKVLYECLDRAFVETTTGARSYTEAIGQAIEDLGKLGITMIDYKGNHRDTVETVVRRAVITGINQASMRISVENAKRLGAEYVIVSSHLGARVSEDKISNHAGWQGKIYKIEGSDKTAPNLEEETGFPNNPLGLGGYNCRHNMFPWFPEMGDKNPFTQYGKAENEKAYEISQKLRAKERAIRKRKRELMALQKGIESADDEALKFELQQRYDKSAQKLQLQNKNYKEFCEENNVKTQSERMKTAKWDRTQARLASAGAQRYRNSLFVGTSNETAVKIYKISEKDIEKSHLPSVPGITKEEHNKLEQMHKKLLTIARDENESKEVAILLGEDLTEIDLVMGTESEIDLNVPGRSQAKFVIHNHPNNQSFSNKDIYWLINNSNTKYFSIIKNDGKIEMLIKDDTFRKDVFVIEYKRLEKKYKDMVESNKQIGYNKIIAELLKKTKSGMVYVR